MATNKQSIASRVGIQEIVIPINMEINKKQYPLLVKQAHIPFIAESK